MALYWQKDECVHFMIGWMLVDRTLSIGYLKEVSYIQKILQTQPHKSFIAQVMSCLSAFKMQLYFHFLMFLEECMQTKVGSTGRNYNADLRLRYTAEMAMKAWSACTQAAVPESIQIALHPYLLYNNGKVMF